MRTMILFAAILLAFPAQAKEILVGPIPATVIQVVDGDTIDVEAQIWLQQVIITRIRIKGIDTPEKRGRCDLEINLARRAKDFLIETISPIVMLTNIQHGKYAGRVLADVKLEDRRDVAGLMIGAGFARAYDGGNRSSWCED